jgi:hypothetical protein
LCTPSIFRESAFLALDSRYWRLTCPNLIRSCGK